MFGEQKAAEDDKGERKVIMSEGEPVLDKSGKPKTYPQRTALQKARSKASNEEQALGQGPDAIVREAIEAQEPEPFNPKKERELIREELVTEFPELLDPKRAKELKRRIRDKFNLVERTKSGEALEGTPKPADVPEKIEVRSREPLKVSEEPSGKRFKVKGQASLSPRILGEPAELPKGRPVERRQRPIPVMREGNTPRRVRLSDAPPSFPYLLRDRPGQAKMLGPEGAARILSSEESAKREQERIEAEKQKKVSQRQKKEKMRAFIKDKPLRYLMALVRKIRR